MFTAWRRLFRSIAAFFRRLFTNQPKNEYERIVFDALYSAGVQLRKGVAG